MKTKDEDKRPAPKPRKHPLLWQAYLWWNQLMQMRKASLLRISSIKKGKSNLNLQYELDMIEHYDLNALVSEARREMIALGRELGPVWDWLVGIKGIGPHTAAKLLALYDDVALFPTISKFWRFGGYAVINGEIDRCRQGEKSPYNRRLKSECHLIAKQFVMHQTPVYADIYYAEKERQRRLHPEPIKVDGKWRYNDGHLQNRAYRKVIKIFLSHLWVVWRESEGLPVTEPYVQAKLGHTNIIGPRDER